jgi:N-acetylmuramoyl-L-alanine amidase
MLQGAFRIAALGALLRAAAALASAPALPVSRLAGVDYVSLPAAASALGMRCGPVLPGGGCALTDRLHRVEIEADNREISVDGLRVFLGDPALLRGDRLHVSRIDYERCLLPMLRPDLIGPAPRPVRVVAIDPGHGGPDRGTENPRLGLMEKTFTLDTALRLRKVLEARGYRVVLTRDSDPPAKIELQIRALIANQAGADLFVSIHYNSLAPDTRTKGIEVFTFPPQSQRSSSEKGGAEAEASPVNRYDGWSVVLAHAVHREIRLTMKTDDRGKKLKHLGVLRALDCPGILVEGGFLSNDGEARRIDTPAYRQQLAEALAAGIDAYARILDSLRPAPAQPHPAKGPP